MEQKLCVIEALVLTLMNTKWNWVHSTLVDITVIELMQVIFFFKSINSLFVKKLINNKSYS